MKVEILDFKPEHFDLMEMRDHEAAMGINGQFALDQSIESKTVFIDGVILTCYGIFENNGLWQVPSKYIDTIPVKYAKATLKIVKDLIKGRTGVHSVCLNDDFHKRWMRFLGFVQTDETYIINGNECILYEVPSGN